MAKRTGKINRRVQEPKAPATDVKSRRQQRAIVEETFRLAQPLCEAEGLELVHVEFQREPGGLTLRFYIDRPGGVSLDDCVAVSRQVEDILDVHLQDFPPYRLEVSSPGIDRPMGRFEDFVRFEGREAKIRVSTAVDGRRNFTGILAGASGETIRLQIDKEIISLNFNDITRARLINFNGEH